MTAPLRFDPAKLGLSPARPVFGLTPRLPQLVYQEPSDAPSVPRRTKLWEFGTNLHCSIIGTCLSTGELRQVLRKVDPTANDGASDHDLHSQAVSHAGKRDATSKLIHKALDRRHHLAIKRFDKAKSADEVRVLWSDAVKRGEIPGAYWAALTHPAASHEIVREAFGQVHMLSHLVGSANRADIRRLCQLETEKAALEEKVARQQTQLRDAIVSRDATIRELNQALAAAAAGEHAGAANVDDAPSERAALIRLVGDIERRLGAEARGRARAEQRLHSVASELAEANERRLAAERQTQLLRDELDAVEARIAIPPSDGGAGDREAIDLKGLALLYVGGRPNLLSNLRALGERCGAEFLHHDGGVEDRGGLLAGLVSRADVVMFPVDCVSHDAASMVKRLCRQATKPYLPLRSAGLSSFLAVLARSDITGLRPVAEG